MLGIALDAMYGFDRDRAEAHMEGLGAYDALLIDPRLFLSLRNEAGEKEQLARHLQARGFDHTEPYPAKALGWFSRSQNARRAAGPQGSDPRALCQSTL